MPLSRIELHAGSVFALNSRRHGRSRYGVVYSITDNLNSPFLFTFQSLYPDPNSREVEIPWQQGGTATVYDTGRIYKRVLTPDEIVAGIRRYIDRHNEFPEVPDRVNYIEVFLAKCRCTIGDPAIQIVWPPR